MAFFIRLSADESTVKYFGHHPSKQFIRGKPICFGYKNWMLCSAEGYCYTCDTYCGKSSITDTRPLGRRVVLSLLEAVATPTDHVVFFDNVFTSHNLLVTLQRLGILCYRNNPGKSPKEVSPHLQKKNGT